MKYKTEHKLYLVVWDDAASNSETWTTIAEMAGPERVISIGWLVRDEPGYITLVSSYPAIEEIDPEYGNTMTIPRGMIIDMQEVRAVNASRKSRRKIHPKPVAEEVHREPGQG